MDSQTKRTLLATLICLAIALGWVQVQQWMIPTPPAGTAGSGPSGTEPGAGSTIASGSPEAGGVSVGGGASASAPTSAGAVGETPVVAAASAPANLWRVVGAETAETIVLGDDRQDSKKLDFHNPYEFSVRLAAMGGGVESVKLSRHRNHLPKDRKNPEPDPYDLIRAITDPSSGASYAAFVTESVQLVEEKQRVRLDETAWRLEQSGKDEATARATIQRGGQDVLEIEKRYEVKPGSPHMAITILVRNLTAQPRDVILEERGPLGFQHDDLRSEYRRVLTAVVNEEGVLKNGPTALRTDAFGAENRTKDLPSGENRTTWGALCNKYFTCIVAPVPMSAPSAGGPTSGAGANYPEYLEKFAARALFDDKMAHEDLALVETYRFKAVPGGGSAEAVIEAYCGPKSKPAFDRIDEERAAANLPARQYNLVSNPDRSSCTFEFLAHAMLWLLNLSHYLVRNYGIAIIILVLIVRTILHPVTKRGQMNMMKMQKSMARLKPRIDAVQQQYKNDKQKLSEETMKIYREEGVNPAGQMLGCLPTLLQMPVWVALWYTLNTNVEMRHQPFFGWIKDLSEPDNMIPLSAAYHFTVPLLGAMMGTVTGFNLLPIIMAATMYGQQKFMQKLTKPAVPAAPKLDAQGQPLPDQMAQQQKMMTYMTLFMSVMFYNFPSGLNLYILSSNLLGMLEQYRIKKHLKEKEDRGDFDRGGKPKPPAGGEAPKGPMWLARLQKRVEQARLAKSGRGAEREKASRPGRR